MRRIGPNTASPEYVMEKDTFITPMKKKWKEFDKTDKS